MALGTLIAFQWLLLFGAVLISSTLADTPANCTYDEIAGDWVLSETERGYGSNIDCTTAGPVVNQIRVKLLFPDVAVDEHGNKGKWTLIYNQGFEVTVNYRKYFAFSVYEQHGSNVTSYCDRTSPGMSHDVLGHNWACFTGRKATASGIANTYTTKAHSLGEQRLGDQSSFVEAINGHQSSWKAKRYLEFETMTMNQINRMKGGEKSRIIDPPSPRPATRHHRRLSQELPDSFDWRNVNGQNFVSPVRNQESCGSCYAFGSLAMIEARLKVLTNNTENVVLSTQDVVSCSQYSQGCEGGFPYLISKYGQDYGFVDESCLPYTGSDLTSCSNEKKSCIRHYVADYNYIGGFYGGCNEDLMRIQLVKNGPIAVSFMVYPDFQLYSTGIYHHTGLENNDLLQVGFNPFAITNHVVLVVGYGADSRSGEKYWIVKNSWGTSWGEDGFFRIRRGTNECNIESIAVEAFPIPNVP